MLMGMPSPVNWLRQRTPTAASVFWLGRVRGLRVGPMMAWQRNMPISDNDRRWYAVQFFHFLRPTSAMRRTASLRVGGGCFIPGGGLIAAPLRGGSEEEQAWIRGIHSPTNGVAPRARMAA